jgi:hypothetical protein
MLVADSAAVRSFKSRGIAALLFFGQFAAVACGSDDDSSGPLGTAGAGRSGSAGAGGSSAGSVGQGVAGARADLSAGAGGVGGFADGAGGISESPVRYPCAGPNIADGNAGQGGEAGQSGSGLSCVLGQTFCFVRNLNPVHPGGARVYVPECSDFAGSLAKCAANPSCDCLCSSWFHCETECRCAESNGFATVTCDQI